MDLTTLRQINLFRNLDQVQLAHLASIMEELTLPKNTMLFKEGDKSEHLFIIQKGKVRISKIIPGIGEEALAIISAGAYFGEMELIEPDIPRAAQALVHETATIYRLSYAHFHDMMRSDHELAQAFLWSMVKTLSERLRDTSDKVVAMFALARF